MIRGKTRRASRRHRRAGRNRPRDAGDRARTRITRRSQRWKASRVDLGCEEGSHLRRQAALFSLWKAHGGKTSSNDPSFPPIRRWTPGLPRVHDGPLQRKGARLWPTNETTSFMRSLCMGRIEQDVIFPFPKVSDAEKETLGDISGALEGLLGPRAEDFRKWDEDGHLPEDFIEELKEFGMFGLVIPEESGGMGLGNMAYSRTLQEVAKYDASVAVTIGAHSSIGMRGLLLFGTDDQKERYYEKLASGEMIAAYCLTEPGAGSDAAAVTTTAVRDGDDWVLNGNKLWITNGGIADFFTVFAKTDEEGGRGKMTGFIVTRDMEGVSIGPHEDKMGLRASSTTTVHLDNVRVPNNNVLGEIGQGFKVAMSILNSGRTGLGGGSVGAMKHLIKSSRPSKPTSVRPSANRSRATGSSRGRSRGWSSTATRPRPRSPWWAA